VIWTNITFVSHLMCISGVDEVVAVLCNFGGFSVSYL